MAGGDVFNIIVWSGYDQEFGMGLIIVFDPLMSFYWEGVDFMDYENESERRKYVLGCPPLGCPGNYKLIT